MRKTSKPFDLRHCPPILHLHLFFPILRNRFCSQRVRFSGIHLIPDQAHLRPLMRTCGTASAVLPSLLRFRTCGEVSACATLASHAQFRFYDQVPAPARSQVQNISLLLRIYSVSTITASTTPGPLLWSRTYGQNHVGAIKPEALSFNLSLSPKRNPISIRITPVAPDTPSKHTNTSQNTKRT